MSPLEDTGMSAGCFRVKVDMEHSLEGLPLGNSLLSRERKYEQMHIPGKAQCILLFSICKVKANLSKKKSMFFVKLAFFHFFSAHTRVKRLILHTLSKMHTHALESILSQSLITVCYSAELQTAY